MHSLESVKMVIHYLVWVELQNRDKRDGGIATTEIIILMKFFILRNLLTLFFYNADFGVDALKDSIGTL